MCQIVAWKAPQSHVMTDLVSVCEPLRFWAEITVQNVCNACVSSTFLFGASELYRQRNEPEAQTHKFNSRNCASRVISNNPPKIDCAAGRPAHVSAIRSNR